MKLPVSSSITIDNVMDWFQSFIDATGGGVSQIRMPEKVLEQVLTLCAPRVVDSCLFGAELVKDTALAQEVEIIGDR